MLPRSRLAAAIATVFIAFGVCPVWAGGLFDSYQKALQFDPDYAAARASYDSDVKSRDLAAAAFFPSINLSLSSDRTHYRRQDLASPVVQSSAYDPTAAALRLTQPLFSMDRLAYRHENELRAVRAEWVLAQARQDLALRVVQTVFNYLLGLDQIALAQAQAQAVQAQLTQLEQMLASRSSTRTDVADARARYELALVQIRAAQSQVQVRRLEFIKLTGAEPAPGLQPLAGSPALQAPEPQEPQAWTEAARERSFKVMAQRATVQLAKVGIERVKAGYYPSVSLVASRQQSSNPNYFTASERTDNLSLQLNMNLFDGGNTRTQTAQAVAQAERAGNELQAAQHDAAIGAGQAYWGVVNGIEQIRAMEQAVAAAALALQGTQLGIKANVKTYADELNALQLLYATRRDLQKERYNYLLNRVQLLSAPGLAEEALLALLAGMLP